MIDTCLACLTLAAAVSKPLKAHRTNDQAKLKEAVIEFSWNVLSYSAAQNLIAERAVGQANSDFSDLRQAPNPLQQSALAISSVYDVADDIMSTAEVWAPFIKNLCTIMNVVDSMTEVRRQLHVFSPTSSSNSQIHPYARAAWGILSALPKVCRNFSRLTGQS